jgi:hypothetical protein
MVPVKLQNLFNSKECPQNMNSKQYSIQIQEMLVSLSLTISGRVGF